METNIIEIAPCLTDSIKCIEFFRGNNLLLQDLWCCGQVCTKVMDVTISDRQRFQCKICRKRASIRINSFWAKSKLALTVLLAILYFFANGSTVSQVEKFLSGKCTCKSIIQWFTYFRDIMTTYFENNPVIFENCTVHIDESCLGGKRKYQRGRIPKVKSWWLLGIVDRTQHRAFVQFIEKRDFISIIPLITRHVRQGCTINTDGAKVYNSLNQMNYTHNTVIHKEYFVDPNSGVHSNWVENFWGNLKMKLKAIRGSQKKMLDAQIDEYLYRYNRLNEGSVFSLLISDISTYYPI